MREHIQDPAAPVANPGGVYTVTSPDVPGLATEGGTPAEILTNVQEALSALLSAWKQLGMDVPPALRPVSQGQE